MMVGEFVFRLENGGGGASSDRRTFSHGARNILYAEETGGGGRREDFSLIRENTHTDRETHSPFGRRRRRRRRKSAAKTSISIFLAKWRGTTNQRRPRKIHFPL